LSNGKSFFSLKKFLRVTRGFAFAFAFLFAGCVSQPQVQPQQSESTLSRVEQASEPAITIASPVAASTVASSVVASVGVQPLAKRFQTSDGIIIAADYYARDSKKGVVLLHMLGRSKSDWRDFAASLNSRGFTVLAIDLRGHGESTRAFDGRALAWSDFNENDFNNMVLDVAAAKKFLAQQGIDSIAFVGASIGANVALNAAAQDSSVRAVALLSPGLNYRGVETRDAMLVYAKSKRPAFIAASEDDAASASASRELCALAERGCEIVVFRNAGHGTGMFVVEPSLRVLLLDWLDKIV